MGLEVIIMVIEATETYLRLDENGCVTVLYTIDDYHDPSCKEFQIPGWIRENLTPPLDRLLEQLASLRFSIDTFFNVRMPMLIESSNDDRYYMTSGLLFDQLAVENAVRFGE